MRCFRSLTIVALLAGTAAADPTPDPPKYVLQSTPLFTTRPPPAAPSLRLEAARVIAERFGDNWRYPDAGTMAALDGGRWFIGTGYYRPRTRRSAALHGGSIGATILGELLLGLDSPLAGAAALITGATLDAAAADVDRDAESRKAR
jgi:hypothetical protein